MKRLVTKLTEDYNYYDEDSQEHMQFKAGTTIQPIRSAYLPPHLKDKLEAYNKSKYTTNTIICSIGPFFLPIPNNFFRDFQD